MKRIFHALAVVMVMGTTLTTTSCSDILETGSERQVFDPELNEKTDSMYYTLGIMNGLQQAIDQYVLVNELRGDLVQPSAVYADSALTQLYNFTATTANKYDSAYVYYRVINNCNYYVTHRDTTLMTGNTKVAIPEYAQALAVRAWCYMQLTRIYGRVPFFTEPLTYISQAENITTTVEAKELCTLLAPELIRFADTPVPSYGTINAGNNNLGQAKNVTSSKIMFPVKLVLADLYLEAGDYSNAAHYYADYIIDNQLPTPWSGISYNARLINDPDFDAELITDNIAYATQIPTNWITYSWESNFNLAPSEEVITYVPMAVNKLSGTVSQLPALFGYNLYSFSRNESELYIEEHALDASEEYKRLVNEQPYYLLSTVNGYVPFTAALGDMRRWASTIPVTATINKEQNFYQHITKYDGSNVIIYRNSVIYLRLAEALNRMGYPDAAFAILKDGLGANAYTMYQNSDSAFVSYLSTETYELLNEEIPFFTRANRNRLNYRTAVGIHGNGCGYTYGKNSLYQFGNVLNQKVAELKAKYPVELSALPDSIIGIDTTMTHVQVNDTVSYDEVNYFYAYDKAIAQEIVEDLICDEYALEAAFEGHRFGDLCRLARNKNEYAPAEIFGTNWGGNWLKGKMSFKEPTVAVDLSVESNWYLPFK